MIPPDHPFLKGHYCDLDSFDLNDPLDLALALRAQSATDRHDFRIWFSKHNVFPDAPDLREAVLFQRWIDGIDKPYIPPLGSIATLLPETLITMMDGDDELLAHDATFAYFTAHDDENILSLLQESRYEGTAWSRHLSYGIELFCEYIEFEEYLAEMIGSEHHDACATVVARLLKEKDPRYRETLARALILHPTSPTIRSLVRGRNWANFKTNVRSFLPGMASVMRLERAVQRYEKRRKRS